MKKGLGVAAAVVLGGCALSGDVSAATKGVDGFHQQLNTGHYEQLYAAAAPAFKATTSEAKFDALLDMIQRKLGRFRSDKVTGWHVNATTGGTFTSLAVTSTYADGQAQEQFVFLMNGSRASLINFQINSPALMR